jgi:hypothetical protein
MTDLSPFPDIELAIRTLLLRDFATDFPTGAHVGVDWPDDDVLPFCRVEKVAPSRRERLTDYPSVDIEILAASRAAAKDLIERIDTHLVGYTRSVVIPSGLVVLDSVTVPISPTAREWDSPNVRRFAGTYQFSVRR